MFPFTLEGLVRDQSNSTIAKYIRFVAKIIRNEYWLLFFIMILAALIRLFRLGQWSLWVDELETLQISQNLFVNLIENPRYFLTQHPTTAFFINQTISLLGVSEGTARLAPVVIGIVSVPILFFIVRRLFNKSTGLIAALLLAMSPWHVIWSQNVRFYVTLLLFFNLALFYFYWSFEENKIKYLLLSIFFLGLATAERLLALYFIPIVLIYLIVLQTNWFGKPAGFNWRNISIVFIPGIIFGMIFAWTYIQDPSEWYRIYFVYSETGPVEIMKQFIQGMDVFLLVLGSLGAIILIGKRQRIVILLILASIVPLLVTMGASTVQYTHGRYTFVALISWIILASVAVRSLFNEVTKEGRWLFVCVFAIILFFVPLQENYEYFTQLLGDRPDWKSAFTIVKNEGGPRDIVVSNDPRVGNYYLDRSDVIGMKTWDPRVKPEAIADLDVDIWYVIGRDSRMTPQQFKWIQENATLYNIDHNFMRIYIFYAGEKRPTVNDS